MQKEATFDLRLNGADANETLALIMACHGFLYNCTWHMRGDYAAKETQQIYCNMYPEDLTIGRKELSKIASHLGWSDSDWRLSTKKFDGRSNSSSRRASEKAARRATQALAL